MHTSAAATNYDTAGYTEQHTDEAAPPNHSNAGPLSNSQPANHDFTNSIPDAQELHCSVKNMRNNASLGPDGFNAAFYKSAWHWLSANILQLVRDLHNCFP
jgi:hypothetical protein